MSYNITWMDGVTNLYDVVYNINDVSSGVVAIMVLMILFFGVYAKSPFGDDKSLMGASFATLIVSLLFWWASMVAFSVPFLMLAILLLSVIMYFSR